MNNNITFVTAFFHVKDYKQPGKSTELYFEHFIKLARTGIQLSVYISPIHHDRLKEIVNEYENVKIAGVIDIKDTWIYQTANINGIHLPSQRNLLKDTFDYFVCQNSKLECIQDSIIKNPFRTDYFAWIDFGIFSVLHDIDDAYQQLQKLSNNKFVTDKVIIPGCWEKSHYNYLCGVIWMIAGGFSIGHKDAYMTMWQKYKLYLPEFIKKYNLMTWEVNLWSAMSMETDWDFHWYYGDHNNSILNVPPQYYL